MVALVKTPSQQQIWLDVRPASDMLNKESPLVLQTLLNFPPEGKRLLWFLFSSASSFLTQQTYKPFSHHGVNANVSTLTSSSELNKLRFFL